MDQAIRVINALLAVLDSPNVEFTGLTTQGVRNVTGIVEGARQFVTQNTPETQPVETPTKDTDPTKDTEE